MLRKGEGTLGKRDLRLRGSKGYALKVALTVTERVRGIGDGGLLSRDVGYDFSMKVQ